MSENIQQQEKLVSRKELFRLLQRRVRSFDSADAKLPEKYKPGKQNTATALNLLSEYVNEDQPLPPSWTDLAINENTPFYFINERDGVLVANTKEYFFATPTAFVKKLQQFYEIAYITTIEEKQEIAAAKAAQEAKAAADLAAIRSGEWVKSRMPGAINNPGTVGESAAQSAEPKVTPRRPQDIRRGL